MIKEPGGWMAVHDLLLLMQQPPGQAQVFGSVTPDCP